MLNRLQQLKKMWILSKKDPRYLEALEKIDAETTKSIPNRKRNGAFIPLMSDDERDEHLRNKTPFWQKLNKRLEEMLNEPL